MQDIHVQGHRVPALGFGTWQLEGEDCRSGVAHALATGYRHIDTAQMYENEQQVGQGIRASGVARDDVWLTTKLALGNLLPGPLRQSVEESLAKLSTDYVDLLLIHWPDEASPLDDALATMLELRDAGMVRALGVSNFPPSWLKAALGLAPVITNQVELHPYLSQDDLLAMCRANDMFLTAYSPLARGRVLDEPVVGEIADAHGAHPAQVAIAWALAHESVAVVPKATAPARIESNFAAAELSLSVDEVARISALDEGSKGRIIDPPFAVEWERTD